MVARHADHADALDGDQTVADHAFQVGQQGVDRLVDQPALVPLAALILIPACQHDPILPTSPTDTILAQTDATATFLPLVDDDQLASAATFHGANGLALNDDGKLLVGSLFGREIGEISVPDWTIETRYGPSDGVEGPDDICKGVDGSVYWTNFWTGDVVRQAPDGAVTSLFVGRGVGPMAVTPDGDLYVARRFLGDGLYRIDPDLAGPAQLIGDPGTLGGLAFDGHGRLFASNWTDGTIMRIWLEVDPNGHIYVSNSQNGAVTKITRWGLRVVGLGAPPGMPSSWQFNDVTVVAEENLAYVTSDIANRVYEISLPRTRVHGDYADGGAIEP